jgi:hypothetical protein
MAKKFQNVILIFLPFLVFIPLFYVSRYVRGIPNLAATDWVLALASSSLVIFNPLFRNFSSPRKFFLMGGSFLICLLLLILFGFMIMGFAFGEGP